MRHDCMMRDDEATHFRRFTSSSETTTRFRHSMPNSLHLCIVSECQLPSHSQQHDILSRDVSLVDETQCREHFNTSMSLGVFRPASFTVNFRVVPSDKRYAVFCRSSMSSSVPCTGYAANFYRWALTDASFAYRREFQTMCTLLSMTLRKP